MAKPPKPRRARRHAHYPRLPFFISRFFQFVSGIAVIAIIYFLASHFVRSEVHVPKIFPMIINHNKANRFDAPWFWVTIHIAAHVTVFAHISTSILHCLHRLSPMYNLGVNLLVFGGWAVGFGGLVAYSIRWKVVQYCDSSLSCRLYEAVLACCVIALVSTLCALILDIIVMKRHRRSVYHNIENTGGKGFGFDDDGISMRAQPLPVDAGLPDSGHRAIDLGKYEPRRGEPGSKG